MWAWFETLDFDIINAIESTIELLAERAREKQTELTSFIQGDVPRLLRGDPGRLRQVLMNLISNAVKFTDRGGIVVSVTQESESTSRNFP